MAHVAIVGGKIKTRLLLQRVQRYLLRGSLGELVIAYSCNSMIHYMHQLPSISQTSNK